MPDPLTRDEIERIKEFHVGVTLTHPCCEEVPRLIAEVEQARELLRRWGERLMERYELRLPARDLQVRLNTSRIVGASFQVGAVDGRGDTVVLLIERPAEGAG